MRMLDEELAERIVSDAFRLGTASMKRQNQDAMFRTSEARVDYVTSWAALYIETLMGLSDPHDEPKWE